MKKLTIMKSVIKFVVILGTELSKPQWLFFVAKFYDLKNNLEFCSQNILRFLVTSLD